MQTNKSTMEAKPESPDSSHQKPNQPRRSPSIKPRPTRNRASRGILHCSPATCNFRTMVQSFTSASNSGDSGNISSEAALSPIEMIDSTTREITSSAEMVLQWLADPTVSIIGIYGSEGVGKTTLADHIQNQLLENHPIYSVSWVTISQNSTIHKLQDDIAKTVDLDLSDDEDDLERIEKLATALEEKNIALILDNVTKYIPLQDVRIPTRCKVILVTRNWEVYEQMNCQKVMLINRLSHEKGWELFMEKIGPGVIFPPPIEQIAKSIVKECWGSPLTIVTMAANMKGVDDTDEWSSALNRIKGNEVLQDDVTPTEEYRVLRYCYEKLKDRNAQQCLVYCASYPEEFKIDREMLIENLIDAGLINGKNSKAEFSNGHAMLDNLENASFLEGGTCRYGKRYVKMKSIVRRFLLSSSDITRPSSKRSIFED